VAGRVGEEDGLGDLRFEVIGAAVFGAGRADVGREGGFEGEWGLGGVC
jgi:hypothetical protein